MYSYDFHLVNVKFRDIMDGLSNTLFVGERCSKMSDTTWTGAVTNGVVPAIRYPDPADQLANAESAAAFSGRSRVWRSALRTNS